MSGRASESNLWNWLSPACEPAGVLLERMENLLKKGTPDCIGCNNVGRALFVELKSVNLRPNGTVLSELRNDQAVTLIKLSLNGARAWVFIQVGKAQHARRFCVSATNCPELLEPIAIERLEVIGYEVHAPEDAVRQMAY